MRSKKYLNLHVHNNIKLYNKLLTFTEPINIKIWTNETHPVLTGAVGACEFSGCTPKFCEENGLRYKAMVEIRKLRGQLTNAGNAEVKEKTKHRRLHTYFSCCEENNIRTHFLGSSQSTQCAQTWDFLWILRWLHPMRTRSFACVRSSWPDWEIIWLDACKWKICSILSGRTDIRQVWLRTLTDVVCHHSYWALLLYYSCSQTCLMDDPVFIHPSSALFKTLPDFVVYHEILETTKMYMKGTEELYPENELVHTLQYILQSSSLLQEYRRQKQSGFPSFSPSTVTSAPLWSHQYHGSVHPPASSSVIVPAPSVSSCPVNTNRCVCSKSDDRSLCVLLQSAWVGSCQQWRWIIPRGWNAINCLPGFCLRAR